MKFPIIYYFAESGQDLDDADGITRSHQEGDTVVVEVGSGRYRFACEVSELD